MSLGNVALSFLFFRVLQFIVRWYLFGKCTFRAFSYFGFRDRLARGQSTDSRQLSAIPPNKKWRISNEAVSLFHSIVSGLWAAYTLLYYQNVADDFINGTCIVGVHLILMSTGYLLHDLIDLLINEQSARIIELLFHHVVVLTGFSTTLLTGKYLGVVMCGLLMELNSIFLHSRSLLNLYGVNKKNPSFRMVALINMITMLVFRLAVSLYLAYWAFTNIIEGKLPWLHAIPTTLVVLSLCTTNSVLAYRVMAADGLLGKSRTRKSPAQTTSTVVDVEPSEQSAESSEDEPYAVTVQTTTADLEQRNLVSTSTETDENTVA